jgi:hypothetical protein
VTRTCAFHQLTTAHLLAADVVVAFDGRDPSAELTIRPPRQAGRGPTGGRVTVVRVMVDACWRDEQVRALRTRLANLRQVGGAAPEPAPTPRERAASAGRPGSRR